MHIDPRPGGAGAIRKVVLHLNVGPEVEGGAQALADYLKTQNAGYHEIVDDKTFVVCAAASDRVWGAAGMNDRGYHICVIGNVQTAQQWADAYSSGELNIAAMRVAQRCHDFALPPTQLTDAQVATDEARGVCDHWAVNRAIVQPAVARGDHSMGPGDHTDVGPGFPWPTFMSLVGRYFTPKPPAPTVKVKPMHAPYTATWVADCDCPTGGGWILTTSGDIITIGTAPFHGAPGNIAPNGEAWNGIRTPLPASDPKEPQTNPRGGPVSYVCVTSGDHRYGY